MFSFDVQAVIEDLLPIVHGLAEGRYAISLGGSHGKGISDGHSDLDFRLFCDAMLRSPEERADRQAALRSAISRWAEQGQVIDGCWIRTIADIDEQLAQWTGGLARPEDRVWTIWGYHLPTDIYHQAVVEDPFGIIAGWKAQLSRYPLRLKEAILKKHLTCLRYWRADYHYVSKVSRRDLVFLAGLTSKLVHDLIQVLFALNETYYVGDGNNLQFLSQFQHVPDRFAERVASILYPHPEPESLQEQRAALVTLIDEVELLASGPHDL